MSATIPVVTLAILSCVNVVLLLGVVRRLNRLTDPARAIDRPVLDEEELSLPVVGTVVGDFVASTTDGDRITTKDLRGHTLVGFFTVGCPPCERFLPVFRSHAADFGRDQVLAVIVGGHGDPTALADQLGDVARVVVERPAGPVSTAFGVAAFPAACQLKGNVITAADADFASTDLAGRPDAVGGVRY
jgi:hypothetical protein